jgi:DNA-binding NarL/FixJ family response regulator
MQSFQILVVEDFEAMRRFVCSTLQQRAEFSVAQARDGLEVVRKAERLQPDLVLLDIGLPNLNGMDVANRVRKLAPAAKILFLSQESSPDIVREALSLGAQGYVQKLHAPSDLLPAIDAVLKGKRFVSRGLSEALSPEAVRIAETMPQPEASEKKVVA